MYSGDGKEGRTGVTGRCTGKTRAGTFRPAAALALLAVTALVFVACSDQKRPNIILVTVDTLRADGPHCTGNPLPLSPAVDSLADRGIVFESCTAHASSTAPALASLMTSRYSSEVGVMNNSHPLAQDCDTLALAMKRRGYRTAAFVSNFNLRERMGFHRGFDQYDARFPNREKNRSGHPERTAERTTAAALSWLDREGDSKTPFFLWLHYQDPHGPYVPPEEFVPDAGNYADRTEELKILLNNWGGGGIPSYQVLGGRRDTAYYAARYDGEIAFFDSHFKDILEALDAKGLTGETAIIFTADHGESMGEHGYYYCHEQDLFAELIQVPLIVALPGGEPSMRKERVCHADILPTIAALGGSEVFPAKDGGTPLYRGRNLLEPLPPKNLRPIYSETNFLAARTTFTSVIVGKWKLIRSSRIKKGDLLFDLETDPGEKVNIFDDRPKVARNMTKILDGENRKAAAGVDAAPLELTPEEREALNSLGYMGE
jgi:arylsulfatase A-like enzyme